MKTYKNNFKNSNEDSYIATITHDLSTPISAQINALHLLLNRYFGELNESQEKILHQIKDSCCYTKNLADNILYSYLYENGQLNLELTYFSWSKLLDEIIFELNSLAIDNMQRIVNFSDFAKTNIIADKFQMKRVVINLIGNAIKYGNPNTNIELYSKIENNCLFFSIKNFSNYIKKDDVEQIFEKFVTCNEKHRTSGLGLYFVKEIITAHNGSVFAHSEKNGECCFGFYLPQSN